MSRHAAIRLWRNLYSYRLFRLSLWSIAAIIATDQIITILIKRFELLPTPMATFPHQPIPSSQYPHLQNLLYAATTLRDRLSPILLPENGSPEDLKHYSDLLTFLATTESTTWVALKESSTRDNLRLLAGIPTERAKPYDASHTWLNAEGIPFTPAEITLRDEYDFYNRAITASKHIEALIYDARAEPETWDPAYISSFVPPAITPTSDSPRTELALTPDQRRKARKLLKDLIQRRDQTIRALHKRPPKPMGWAPQQPGAWDRTRRADIDSGNLHGNPDWKPMYRDWRTEKIWDILEEVEEVEGLEAGEEGDEDLDKADAEREHADLMLSLEKKDRKSLFIGELREVAKGQQPPTST